MPVRIVTQGRNLVIVQGVMVNYGLTPVEAIKDIPNTQPEIADYPLDLWNGGKTGTGMVEVDIPIYHKSGPSGVSITKSRQAQAKIGYGLPVELVALKDHQIIRELYLRGLWRLWAIEESDEKLWQPRVDEPAALVININPSEFGIHLVTTSWMYDDGDGLIGNPTQISK